MTKLLSSSTCSRVVDTLERRKRIEYQQKTPAKDASIIMALQKLKEKNSDRVRIPPMKRKKIKQVSWISGDVQNNQIDQNASHLASTPRFHRAVIRRPSECVDIVTTDCRAKFVVGFCVQYCVGESQQRPVGSSYGTLAHEISIEVHDNICKFAKNGLAPSEIGVILRDSHGIAQVNSLTGSKILRILKSHGLATEMPEDLYHLIKKAIAIRKLYNVFTAIRAFRLDPTFYGMILRHMQTVRKVVKTQILVPYVGCFFWFAKHGIWDNRSKIVAVFAHIYRPMFIDIDSVANGLYMKRRYYTKRGGEELVVAAHFKAQYYVLGKERNWIFYQKSSPLGGSCTSLVLCAINSLVIHMAWSSDYEAVVKLMSSETRLVSLQDKIGFVVVNGSGWKMEI
ncbi:40S ribosomal protein S13 [Tanacetum coccineum]